MTEAGENAAESLARGNRVQATVSGQADRYPKFLVIYGAGSIVMTAWSGFLTAGPLSMIGFLIAWPVFVTTLCLWVNGQRANLHGMGLRHVLYLTAQFAIFLPVLLAGLGTGMEGQVTYWLPMGLLVSLPIFIGAAYEARLLRRARGET